jgi:two-component system CheB/CheR fusion protein
MTAPVLDPDFESLLLYLKEARGFDFTGYKRSSLMRRMDRRMSQVGIGDYTEYLDYLQLHQDEFTALFNTILINVTGFFRDPEAWDHLRIEIQRMLEDHTVVGPIRLWSAGCASGEEAYTLAIILAESLGIEEFRKRVKIYATDVDEEGLTHARHATYTESEIRGVPPELLAKYFELSGNRYLFRKDLRRLVIFGRNDLVQDAPISRIDVLTCRNTLMYLNAETQSRILARFHFALADTGLLFLGKAEMLLSHADMFQPVDLKRRIFHKFPRRTATAGNYPAEVGQFPVRDRLTGLDQLRGEAFLSSPVAQVVVTADGLVALTNRQAEGLFGISSRDVGRPFRDLDLSYRPAELRRHIEQAQVERRSIRIGEVEYIRSNSDVTHLDIQLNPLVDIDSGLLGISLVFHETTEQHRLQDELENTNRQLETAYEELQSTNEELETTNEELQSTVEELETTNEELQSTNEELETMNEELHSTNDELQSINDQLQDSSDERNAATAFLEAVLTSLRAAVAVINRDLQVLVWNRQAEDLWGLRSEEAVGQHFLNLDIGLPAERLRPIIRSTLNQPTDNGTTAVDLQLQAVNRRGRSITVRVVCTPLTGPDHKVSGVVLVVEQDGDVIGEDAAATAVIS